MVADAVNALQKSGVDYKRKIGMNTRNDNAIEAME